MILAILMVFSSMVAATTVSVSAAEEAEDHGTQPTTWWHDVVISTYGADAKPADVFSNPTNNDGTSDAKAWLIDNPTQLAYMAYYLESGALNGATAITYFYIRGNDCGGVFDMSAHQWKPVYAPYKFKLSGRATCKITGLKLTASEAISGYQYERGCAMFSALSDTAVVENLNLEVKILNPVLTSTASLNNSVGVAGIVAYATGTSQIRNSTVTLDLDVNGTGGAYIYAGVVAYTASNAAVTGCTVKGDMKITAPASKEVWVGGVLGYHTGAALNTMTNEATIAVTSASQVNVGGLIAKTGTFASGSTNTNKGAINVTLTGATTTYSMIGGVVGASHAIPYYFATLKNEGAVTVTTSGAAVYLGGITGGFSNTGAKNTMTGGMTNTGAITLNVNAKSSANQYVGGLFGIYNATVAGSTLKNAQNSGAVSVVAVDTVVETVETGVGGLIGQMIHLEVTGCKNDGPITVTNSSVGKFHVGGIAGLMHRSSSGGNALISCENTANGKITLTDKSSYDGNRQTRYVGGIVAYFLSNTIKDCVNNGDITYNCSELGSVGGILAAFGDPNLTVSGCTNNGNITVANSISYGSVGKVAGIAAEMQKTGAVIDNCTNTGTVRQTKGTGQNYVYMGGIVAQQKDGTVKNCENKGIIKTDNLTKGGNERHALHIGGLIGYAGNAATLTDLTNSGALSITFTQGAKEATNVGGIGATNTGNYIAGVVGLAEGTTTLTNITNKVDVIATTQDGREDNSTLKLGGVANLRGSTTATNVSNLGSKVDFTSNKGASLFIGGVFGELADTAKATTVVNYATVNASKTSWTGTDAGGIVGRIYAGALLDGAINYANVSSTTTSDSDCSAGGIVGVAMPVAAAAARGVYNATNYGEVAIAGLGNNAAAGICARVSAGTVAGDIHFENCFTVGDVESIPMSGGIIGHTRAESVSGGVVTNAYTVYLTNCISYGTGAAYSLVGSLRNDALVLENCFGNTEYFLNYFNQNSANKDSVGQQFLVTVNGVNVEGNSIAYNPDDDTCAHVEIATLDKARVRLDAAGTDESGIRFDSYITKESYDEIKAMTNVDIDFDTIIAPTQNLAITSVANAYDKLEAMNALGGKRYTVIPFDQEFLDPAEYGDTSGDKYYFAGALNQIKTTNYNLSFTAIACITITIDDMLTFKLYADYDVANTERARSIAQVATMAFEDRATERVTIDGIDYKYLANEDHECYLGNYSLYSNAQLAKLKTYSSYDNTGKEAPTGLSVNGVSISEYKIVYAQSPIYSTYGSTSGKTLYGDLHNVTLALDDGTGSIEFGDVLFGATYDYDFQTAIAIRDAIKDTFGVELEVVPDYDIGGDASVPTDDVITPEGQYEILVGQTNRAKTQSAAIFAQDPDEFTLMINDDDIVVCGGSYGATWHAAMALKAILGEHAGENYNLKMAGNMSAKADMTIIACIGDSITRGSQALPDNDFGGNSGANDLFGGTTTAIYLEQFLSYPANLQRMLWKDAYVYNFGRGNSTAGNYNNPGNYYASTDHWNNCYNTSNSDVDFDLVFMMHGTNDSTRPGMYSQATGAYNWIEEDKAAFRAEVQNLMDKILEGSPNATFIFNNIPHRFDTDSNTEEHNTMAMAAIQKEMVTIFAETYDVYHYDMNSFTRENLVNTSCECYDAPAENIDSTAEEAAHGYYYNCETPNGKHDGTHPNFRGYNKIAEAVYSVVDYILNGAEKPVYMIDVQ